MGKKKLSRSVYPLAVDTLAKEMEQAEKLREQMHIPFVVYVGYMEGFKGLKSKIPHAQDSLGS